MSDTSAVPASLLLSVLANVADAVLVSDSARRVLYMNPAAEALTRWSFDSAHQESIDRVAPLLDRALDRMLDASVAAAFQPARLARRDGTTAVVE